MTIPFPGAGFQLPVTSVTIPDQEVKLQDEEAWYGADTFSIGGLLWQRYKWPLGDIFLRVSTGRLPPNLENDTSIILGVNLLPEKSSK